MIAEESRVSTSGPGEKTVEAGVGNDTDSEGGTVSDIMTGTCGENTKQTQKMYQQTQNTSWWRDYSTDILFVFWIPIKTYFINLGDNLSSPGDKF